VLPNAHLHLLATDRTLEPEVSAAIRALGSVSERVHVHDSVARSEMRRWYRAADIIFSTSWREGSGYSLIEAITEGCVPVATSIPSHRAIVGELAHTFPPGDADAAAALLAEATSIAASSVRAFANIELSWKRVSAQLSYAYESVRHPRL
jgi:glycosyltransferase involved in cell wall biosynthesis